MEKEKNTSYIVAAEGVLRGFIITVVLLLIFAVIMTFTEISETVSSTFYLLTTLLSIIYGTIYAVRKTNSRGFLVGIMVTLLYLMVIYVVSVISGNSAVIGYNRVARFLLALVVGAASGIVARNL